MNNRFKIRFWLIGGLVCVSIFILGTLAVIDNQESSKNELDNWQIIEYSDSADNFGGKQHHAAAEYIGSFNNTAISKAPLKVEVLVAPDSTVTLRFLKHDSLVVRNKTFEEIIVFDGKGKNHKIDLRIDAMPCISPGIDSSGNFHDFNYSVYNKNGDNIPVYDKGFLWEILNKGGIAKFRIYSGDNTFKTEYRFKVNTSGLKKALKQIRQNTDHK